MSWNRRSRNVIIGVRLSIIGANTGTSHYWKLLPSPQPQPPQYYQTSNWRSRRRAGGGYIQLRSECWEMNDRKSFKLCKSRVLAYERCAGLGFRGQQETEFS